MASDDDEDQEHVPLANLRDESAPADLSAATGSDDDRARDDYHDLLALERSGVSVTRAPQQSDEPVVVTGMPMANTHEDRVADEADAIAAGNYDAEWINRRDELNDLWELERTGQSVVWQDPQDRVAIIRANQRDLTAAIADEINNRAGIVTEPTVPPTLSTYELRHQAVTDPGLRQLITMLDSEGEGGTVLWVQPQDRDLALSARLAHFRGNDLSVQADRPVEQAYSPGAPVSTTTGDAENTNGDDLVWPDLNASFDQHVAWSETLYSHTDEDSAVAPPPIGAAENAVDNGRPDFNTTSEQASAQRNTFDDVLLDARRVCRYPH